MKQTRIQQLDHISTIPRLSHPSTSVFPADRKEPSQNKQDHKPRAEIPASRPSIAPVEKAHVASGALSFGRQEPFSFRQQATITATPGGEKSGVLAPPSHGAETRNRDQNVSRAQEIAAVDAGNNLKGDDIDTQLLLARIAAKKSNPTAKLDASIPEAHSSTSQQSNKALKSSRKKRRYLACDYCRSKRRKCEKDPEDPDGACLPCTGLGCPCTFELIGGVVTSQKNTAQIDSNVQIRDSQEEAGEPEPDVRRLRSRSISFSASRLPQRSIAAGSQTKAPVAEKRSSQRAMPPLLEKMVKGESKRGTNIKSITVNPTSEATTMTADPNDLDMPNNPLATLQKALTFPNAKLSSDRPAFSELTERSSSPSRQLQHIQSERKKLPMPKKISTSHSKATAKDIATSSRSPSNNPTEVSTGVEGANQKPDMRILIREALRDDEFLRVCKEINTYWETHVVIGKI